MTLSSVVLPSSLVVLQLHCEKWMEEDELCLYDLKHLKPFYFHSWFNNSTYGLLQPLIILPKKAGDEQVTLIKKDSFKSTNITDDDIWNELDKMVSDNVQERLKEAVRPSQDIVIPLLGKTHKSTDNSFVLLLRKGNKTQCKSLNVPLDSDLVKNLKYQEEVERQEKEKVKKLTLDIQRMQLEDSLEQQQENSSLTSNVNHQRRARYSSTQKVDRFLDLYYSSK